MNSSSNKDDNPLYDASNMECEVLYKFRDKYSIEISAYLNAERNTVVYWVSDVPGINSFNASKSKEEEKQFINVNAFTDKLHKENWKHTN